MQFRGIARNRRASIGGFRGVNDPHAKICLDRITLRCKGIVVMFGFVRLSGIRR